MRLRKVLNDRTVNTLLLAALLTLGLTGLWGLFANASGRRLVFDLHRLGGAALLVLLVPKAGIIARALRGRRPARGRAALFISLGLLGLTAVVVAAALGWSLARGPWSGAWGLPLIVVHWYVGIGLLPLLALHVRKHWRRPRRVDFAGRRRILALGAGALLAALAWRAVEAGAGAATAR
ncbi:MAG TPA: hypothetical protein VFL91_17285, partial [Thermomicrobiales bacterium]|nr:hypothetical protein [Thermomicrobiales bacterium]